MKKKLVFVSPVFPYPCYSGGNHYAFHLTRNLAKHYDVDFVCEKDPIRDHSPGQLAHLSEFCRLHIIERPQKSLAQKALDTLQPHYFKGFNNQLLKKIQSLLPSTDILHFDYLRTADYLTHLNFSKHRPLTSFFTHNYEVELFKRFMLESLSGASRWKNQIAYLRLVGKERKIIESVDQFYSISQRDSDLYKAKSGRSAINTNNGIDTSTIEFRPTPNSGEVIFIGNLLWGPNAIGLKWFMDNAYSGSGINLRVVGHAYPETDLSFVERHKEVKLHKSPPEVLSFLYNAAVSIVPLLDGSGSRGKILESMAAGKPVISTSKGAEGLEIEPEKHYLLADKPEDFIRQTKRVLQDKNLYMALANSGRKFVECTHDWKIITQHYINHFQKALER